MASSATPVRLEYDRLDSQLARPIADPRFPCVITTYRLTEHHTSAVVSTPRAEIETRVLVTERMRPIKLGRRTIQQIGMPYRWGNRELVTGDSTNELIAFGTDPNASIQESKALIDDIRAGRRGRRKSVTRRPTNALDEDLRDLSIAWHRPDRSARGSHIHLDWRMRRACVSDPNRKGSLPGTTSRNALTNWAHALPLASREGPHGNKRRSVP